MSSQKIEFGLDTPVFVTVDAAGRPISGDVVIRNTVEEAVLADAVGIDSFNIGEHYRPFDTASRVAKSVYTLTGSCVLSTVTAVPSRMRSVRPAIAARIT